MRWPWQPKPETYGWCGCPDSWTGMGRMLSHDRLQVFDEQHRLIGVKYVCHVQARIRFVRYETHEVGAVRDVGSAPPFVEVK